MIVGFTGRRKRSVTWTEMMILSGVLNVAIEWH